MPQIQAEDFQAMAPLCKVRLANVTGCGVTRKACRHNEVGSRTQQPDASLVPNLHPAASEQGNPSTQISWFGAFAIVQPLAPPPKPVVQLMHLRIMPFAHVPLLRITAI